MSRGDITGRFIELNICNGGCIKGPAVDRQSISRFKVKLDMEEQIAKVPVKRSDFYQGEKEEIPSSQIGQCKGSELVALSIEDRKPISFEKKFSDRSPRDPMPSEEEIRRIDEISL